MVKQYIAWDGSIRQWKYTDGERKLGKCGFCYDCERPYESCGDCVIPDDIWEQINPTYHKGGGILCANCIIERLHHLGIGGIDAKLW